MAKITFDKLHDDRIDALFKQYYPRLCAYAARFVGTDSAHDLVMDCFVKLWERRDKLENRAPASLLFVMVRNSCLNYLRQKKLITLDELDYLADIDGSEKLYQLDFGYTGEDKLLYGELQEQIDLVMGGLPPTCRKVFERSRYEGMKNREIAEEMHTSVTNIEKHISKALAAFAAHFKEHYPIDLVLCLLLSIMIGE